MNAGSTSPAASGCLGVRLPYGSSEAQSVASARVLRSPGIRFESDDGRYDGVIFWTSDPGAVLDALRERGWPVSDDKADTAQG